ncbi:hypothetical protein KSB_00200 [Ktedonobacter robiniae]|uniref:Uncharacterized protein n=1 Tax=Ktedonobacter robiniae TaxID=2778365 RepID=A0ABQ3UFZ7_9CHLR|nr:hypothetical protein KSB_00200 [Ktedonobacter robiniae]
MLEHLSQGHYNKFRGERRGDRSKSMASFMAESAKISFLESAYAPVALSL